MDNRNHIIKGYSVQYVLEDYVLFNNSMTTFFFCSVKLTLSANMGHDASGIEKLDAYFQFMAEILSHFAPFHSANF